MKTKILRSAVLALAGGVALVLSGQAGAVEYKTVENKKLGYSFKVPAQFELQGDLAETSSWIYQPGSAPAAGGGDKEEKKTKKKKLGLNVGGLSIGGETAEESGSSSAGGASGGGLQPALQVYVNWVWMPDVDSGTMYSTNKKGDQQDISSPSPKYKDIKDFDKKQGYAFDGNTYWYKEVDKSKGDEIHRWHIKSAGNKSFYTVGLTGTYEQFKEWGPIFEEVIKSWKLIPMEK
jgi:hypothetical protein